MYKVSEVGKILGVTRGTVYKKIKSLSPLLDEHVFMKNNVKHIDETGLGILRDNIIVSSGDSGRQSETLEDTEQETTTETASLVDVVNADSNEGDSKEQQWVQMQLIEELRKQLADKDEQHKQQLEKQEIQYERILQDKERQIGRLEGEIDIKNQQFSNFQVLLKQEQERTLLLEHQLEDQQEKEPEKPRSFWSRLFGTNTETEENEEE